MRESLDCSQFPGFCHTTSVATRNNSQMKAPDDSVSAPAIVTAPPDPRRTFDVPFCVAAIRPAFASNAPAAGGRVSGAPANQSKSGSMAAYWVLRCRFRFACGKTVSPTAACMAEATGLTRPVDQQKCRLHVYRVWSAALPGRAFAQETGAGRFPAASRRIHHLSGFWTGTSLRCGSTDECDQQDPPEPSRDIRRERC